MPIQRRAKPAIEADLAQKKMVFVAGPRQCGKTTLAKDLVEAGNGAYYDWDNPAGRAAIRSAELSPDAPLWAFDELHKFRRWRDWLKAIYDEHRGKHSILVTGSARLDLYSRGGETLQGRYLLHRMHPLMFSEVTGAEFDRDSHEVPELPTRASDPQALEALLRLGGFPEPFVSGSERSAARWRLAYGRRLVQEEVRSLEAIQDLDRMELLYQRLSSCVGSVLSINSLREDLEVAFDTARKWILVFERLFGVFRLPPFGAPRIKAVKKETKLYFWDWARVEPESARFENLVGCHLLRFAHWCEDVEGVRTELRYFRDVVGHEVDFVLLRQGKPWIAVEAKLDDRPLDPGLRYFLERVRVPHAFQVSLRGRRDFAPPSVGGCEIRVLPAARRWRTCPEAACELGGSFSRHSLASFPPSRVEGAPCHSSSRRSWSSPCSAPGSCSSRSPRGS